jgi:hypothetical protein
LLMLLTSSRVSERMGCPVPVENTAIPVGRDVGLEGASPALRRVLELSGAAWLIADASGGKGSRR